MAPDATGRGVASVGTAWRVSAGCRCPSTTRSRRTTARWTGTEARRRSTVARGKLRLYLGAAPGVGKTYAMLNEGWRRKERGTDVVIGWVQDHGRPHTDAQIRDLEIFPRRTTEYRGQTLEE